MTLASPGGAEEAYLDDRALSIAFTRKCAALIAGNKQVEGEVIRASLKREQRFPGSLLSEPAPARKGGEPSNAVEAASNATLIVGHIYLCDRCDKWHNNLAGGVLLSSDGLLITN